MDSDLASQYFKIHIALNIVATGAVALRLISRSVGSIRHGADDVWCLLGWLFLAALTINAGYMFSSNSGGVPLNDLTDNERQTFLKCFYISQILYFFCMLPTKLSVLALYRRIFTLPRFRLASLLIAILCVAWAIGGLIPTIFRCSPVEGAWITSRHARCLDAAVVFEAITIANLFTDVIVLCLPMPVIWRLQLDIKTRIALVGIFLSGGTVCVVALMRIIRQQALKDKNLYTVILDCSLWTVTEPALAVFSVCLPTLRPLVHTIADVVQRITCLPSTTFKSSSSSYLLSKLGTASRFHSETAPTIATPNDDASLPNHLYHRAKYEERGLYTSDDLVPLNAPVVRENGEMDQIEGGQKIKNLCSDEFSPNRIHVRSDISISEVSAE